MWAGCLDQKQDYCDAFFTGVSDEWKKEVPAKIRRDIETGVYPWLAVLVENQAGGPAGLAELEAWESMYPKPQGAYLIADPQRELSGSLTASGYPSFHMIDEDFNWARIDDLGPIFDYLFEYE